MAVSKEVEGFITKSLAENNKSLMTDISKLITDSIDKLKRSSSEAAEDQLREIKKIRREEPKSFKRKGNEIQYKFNSKVQGSLEDAKSHLQANAIDKAKEALGESMSLLAERQKLILLADKSEFGWKTVEEYIEHELADDEQDGKKIHRAGERAEKALKSVASQKAKKQGSFARSSPFAAASRSLTQSGSSTFVSWRPRQSTFPRTSVGVSSSSRPGNCFACGKFGHWRAECRQRGPLSKATSDTR